MDHETRMKRFRERIDKMATLDHATAALYYDAQTVMPRGGAEDFGKTAAELSGENYRLLTCPEMREDIDAILASPMEADLLALAEANELSEQLRRIERIPLDEYMEFERVRAKANSVWHEAKEQSDFALFAPLLKRVFDMTRRFAALYDPERDPYDNLLDEYCKGLTKAKCEPFFDGLKADVAPLIAAVGESGRSIDDSFLAKAYPIEGQRALSKYVMELMTVDPAHCILGEVEHPFTINFSRNDVRISTHYYENAVASSLYSVIHESGHALYELHVDERFNRTPLCSGSGMDVHESQSRFYENCIGRSEAFCKLLWPKIRELFPAQTEGYGAHDFYLAVNSSKPDFIRTEADELTYPMHILVRYELEKLLIADELPVSELPAAWNALYKKYLGITPPNDRVGVLQDSHWSNGQIGYFPSYALGSAYAAQFLRTMEGQMDLWGLVEKGELKPIADYLEAHIWRFGKSVAPADLIENACGAPFDPAYYSAYLKEKFSAIYGL